MKNIKVLCACLIVSVKLLGQNTVLYLPGGSILNNSPNSHLDVRGSSKFATSNDQAHSWLPFINGSSYISSYTPLGEGDIIFRTDNGTSYSEYLRIKGTSGNVGIGTASPGAPLHVHGTGNAKRIVLWDGGTSHQYMGFGHYSNVFRYQSPSVTDDHVFYAATSSTTSSELVRIKGNGNVGIGTDQPDAKLTVKGNIHTREVTVDMAGSLAGPDYVFEKDYNLLPLSELETYISQNKHLPEVPSAKEMDANGLNLKEMNLILLKKVEELTLHLIEQQKYLLKIDKENKDLRQRMSLIENK